MAVAVPALHAANRNLASYVALTGSLPQENVRINYCM